MVLFWAATAVICTCFNLSSHRGCAGLQGAVLLDAAMAPRTVWQFEAVMVLLSGHWPPRGLLSGMSVPSKCLVAGILPGGRARHPSVHRFRCHRSSACGRHGTSDCGTAAGQWPPNEARDGSGSGSDSDARRGSGSHWDAVGGLTSDGGASPRTPISFDPATPGGSPLLEPHGGTVAGGSSASGSGSVTQRRRRVRSGSRRRSGAGGMYFPVVHCGSVRQAARVVAMREVDLKDDPALGAL